jgi:hypothetical protein
VVTWARRMKDTGSRWSGTVTCSVRTKQSVWWQSVRRCVVDVDTTP